MSLRDLRRLKVLHGVLEKRFTQKVASSMLNLSERQLRRLVKSIRELGDGSIVHRGRGRPSNHRLPERIKSRVMKLYLTKYNDFGPTLAAEKLMELDGIAVSRETLRQWLIAAVFWSKRRKHRGHRQWRVRKECFGAMVQMDGSHHAWLEDRGPWLVLIRLGGLMTPRTMFMVGFMTMRERYRRWTVSTCPPDRRGGMSGSMVFL